MRSVDGADVVGFYGALGIGLLGRTTSEGRARCFAHPERHRRGDRSPSASVNLINGAWCCHGCGARGGAFDAALARGLSPHRAMQLLDEHGLNHRRTQRDGSTPRGRRVAIRRAGPSLLGVSDADVDRWARALAEDEQMLSRLTEVRGWDPRVLARRRVGLFGGRITIPTHDAAGQLCGVVRYDPDPQQRTVKMLAVPGSRRDLFPAPERLPRDVVVLCEGEPDALAAESQGIRAVAVPGTTGWRADWSVRLVGFDLVIVCMDCDAPGRLAAREIAQDLQSAEAAVRVVDLAPARDDGYDLTDALREHCAWTLRLLLAAGADDGR